jgi:putative ABC transport system permease protein
LVLLIGAGLMIRSLAALWNVELGFRPDNVVTFGLSLSPSMNAASPETIRATLRELNSKLSTTPGVKAVSFSVGALPLQGEDDLFFWIDGGPKPASQSEMNMAIVYRVEPDYLSAMGIRLRQGRFFNAEDDQRSQPVVVIDEIFARKHFGNVDPVGQRINFAGVEKPSLIVGVVDHVNQWGVDSDDKQSLRAQLYQPLRQLPDAWLEGGIGDVGVVMRSDVVSSDGGTTFLETIRQVVRHHNAQNVIFRPQTMNEVIANALAERRFSMILLDAFGILALLLSSVGLYGVVSYLVGERTHELGIRLALGAQRNSVLLLVLRQGMKMALAGVALGLIAALALTRFLSTMLFGVSTTDPTTFVFISLILSLVALCACIIPARRATRVDPLGALRYE